MFQSLSDAGIVVAMIIQSQSLDGHTDMSFTLPRLDLKRCIEVLEEQCADLTDSGKALASDPSVANLSVVGVGMRSHSGVAGKMFRILAEVGTNMQLTAPRRFVGTC